MRYRCGDIWRKSRSFFVEIDLNIITMQEFSILLLGTQYVVILQSLPVKTSITILTNSKIHAFQHIFLAGNGQKPYFCIVFFIVLDLRLTRLGYSGIPFFMPISLLLIFFHQAINYFEERLTYVSAESFNAKIKAFRSQLRGVSDVKFFMFRLAMLYT